MRRSTPSTGSGSPPSGGTRTCTAPTRAPQRQRQAPPPPGGPSRSGPSRPPPRPATGSALRRAAAGLDQKCPLNPRRERKRIGKPRLAGQLAGRQHSGQFRQRQRAAPRLRHQRSTDLSAHRHARPLSEQSTRGRRVKAAQDQLGKPITAKCAYVTLAGTEDERHPVGQQPPGHEQQRLSRGRVQPLSVIHHGDDRTFLRGLTQQAQRRDEDSKPVRARALLLAERPAQRPRLRRGQPVQARQHGAQQPVQCRER